ncbi:hypothetical protein D3C72_945570 [compost metagenome]
MSATLSRPVVYDYSAVHEFFQAMLNYYKATSRFSIRQRTQDLDGCSPALVSQVLAGKRRLTRDQLPSFAKLFKLTQLEFEFIDKNLRTDLWEKQTEEEKPTPATREAKNHILNFWLNSYVKDLVNLKGFQPDSKTLHRMLAGIATPGQIERSINFLFKEGFWRRKENQSVVPDDPVVLSSNDIPNEKIRDFHKQALKVALRGMDVFPSHRRKASTILVSVDKEKVDELRGLVDAFQERLIEFIEQNPAGRDELVQIAIHMTPVGGKNE